MKFLSRLASAPQTAAARAGIDRMLDAVWSAGVAFLNGATAPTVYLSPTNFARLSETARPGDVLLVAGRTRVARAIRAVTHSIWTHSALVAGGMRDLRDPALRAVARAALKPEELEAPILIESELGRGVFVSSLLRYRNASLRLCRPRGLSQSDAKRVVTFALLHLGREYDVRQILDLARFLVPWWTVIPRRWHSTLFEHNAKGSTREICSTLVARAFRRVRFPVMPLVVRQDGALRLLQSNAHMVTPRDFDHSPYFDVIKYPLLGGDDIGFYRQLPWSAEGLEEWRTRQMLTDFERTYARPVPEPDIEDPAAAREGG